MLSELYSEDEDPWDFKQHQGNCCNNFVTRFAMSCFKKIIFINFKLNF